MNCHRRISENIVADFPSATPGFINGNIDENNLIDRLNGNHHIFTEINHGFINPISEKFSELISEKFDWQKWDNNSGYQGIDVFNEYMTWAVWALFAKEYFPDMADSLIQQWQNQNVSRGFFAQKAFTDKLFEITKNVNNLNDVYIPLLEWCKTVEDDLSTLTITNDKIDKKSNKTTIVYIIVALIIILLAIGAYLFLKKQ